MQESSQGADHGSNLCLHMSLYAGNCSEHVRTLLIGYRSGGTPDFLRNLRARDGIAGRRRGSSACQRAGDLPALRVARRCSPVGFDQQQRGHLKYPSPSPLSLFRARQPDQAAHFFSWRHLPALLLSGSLLLSSRSSFWRMIS